jgi:dienelactone hydrolase
VTARRRWPPYRWRRTLAIAAVLALVAVEGRYAWGGYLICHLPRVRVTADDAARVREALPTVEDAAFRTSDGLTLRGFYVPPKNGAIVVMGHGLGANRMYFLPYAEMLARHGYGALFFDWRAHGESDGDVSTISDREQDDLRSAIDFVAARPGVAAGRIATMGFSVGASTAALEAVTDSRVRAIVLEAVYTSFEDEMRAKHGKYGILSLWPTSLAMRLSGVRPENIRPVDHIAEIAPRPLLFIAGSLDEDTPVPVVERVYAQAGDPKQLLVVQGAEHGKYERTDPGGCERTIVRFLDAALLSPAPDGSPPP